MSKPTLDAPTSFANNVAKWRWPPRKKVPRGEAHLVDTSAPPDRFVSFPGFNNWRGGAIFSFRQMKQLRDEFGVKTIVNLAREANDWVWDPERGCGGSRRGDGRDNQCEGVWAKELGLRYIYMPLSGSWRMTQEKWTLLRDALAEGNVYVHCAAGVDRTGAVVARWIREIDPSVSHDQVMRYTRAIGGAWRREGDPNAKLRDWVAKGRYDPELAARALRPRGGILPGLAVFAVGLFVFFRLRQS